MNNFRQQLAHDRLRQVYHAWLQTVRTEFGRTGMVAGAKTQAGFHQAHKLMQTNLQPWNDFTDAWINTPERVWVWSDHHIYHKNICRYAGRPFDSVHRMNEVMLQNAQHLTDDDFVLFGGDVSFGSTQETKEWLRQIKGRKFLIAGNHDIDRGEKLQVLGKLGFDGVADCFVLEHGDQLLWITHYPLQAKDIPTRAINVHGHIHQHLIDGPFANMCVEHLNYAPRLLKDLVGEA